MGDNTFAHIPDRRLHDCAQFTCILVLRLRTIPFQYTCIIYYVCAHLKIYPMYFKREQYFRHLYLYDLYRTGENYLIYIIHSEIKLWFGNMENLSPTAGNLAFYMMVFSIESIEKPKHRELTWRWPKNECKVTCTTDLSDLIDNNSALTWHKIYIRMRLRIGENARVSRAYSHIRVEYVYRILYQVNALLLSLYCNH